MIDLNHSRNLALRPHAGGFSGVFLMAVLLWAAALALPASDAQAGAVLTSLHSFGVFTNGVAQPQAALVPGSDGYFYGTTSGGGTNGGYGTVFKLSTDGTLTSLYSFTGRYDGANPLAPLVQGSDGYFYGTTYGRNDVDISYNFLGRFGTVFKISTNGTLTTLYWFTGGNDGAYPSAALVQGGDGYFYGTTSATVFKISTNGALTTLYSFTGGLDGGAPNGLVQGSNDYFYGTTVAGGNTSQQGYSYGTVFKISPNGTLTTLYWFTGGHDGGAPNGLVQASDGFFYGTTADGGTTNYPYGSGTVFKISTNGALTTLYSFTGGHDGGSPNGLVQGSDGYFYGTTVGGGNTNQQWYGYGTVFKISTNGALTTLHVFTDNDGAGPFGALVQGSDGYFYGTTGYGGVTNSSYPYSGYGTLFKISTSGTLTSLYAFTGGSDGTNPDAGLVQGSDGYFYGTTGYGGTNGGYGTVFRISTNGTLTTLYSFTGGNDGANPGAALVWGGSGAGLVQGSDGYFYGTTIGGGNTNQQWYGYGTVFKISANGALTALHLFTGGDDGAQPQAAVVEGSDGYFYGTTAAGGTTNDYYPAGCGTMFKISTNGALTTLHSFTGGDDGARPQAAVVEGSDGYFYGTTAGGGRNGGYGTVFKITASGALTTLHSFGSLQDTNGHALDGENPRAALVQGSDGSLYGTTYGREYYDISYLPLGRFGSTVFKISTNGALTTLHLFTGGYYGGSPNRLVQGRDGCFYGTTQNNDAGTAFKISATGVLTTLYSFTGGQDGESPNGLVQGSDGCFYGTTQKGGAGGNGTVFRLTILPEPPELNITPSAAGFVLTWPTNASGFTLQSTTNLVSPAFWTTNSSLPVVVNGMNTVTNPISGAQQFFRLSQ
jgi:uncharacterized repeat protein (TIGR03803 family)